MDDELRAFRDEVRLGFTEVRQEFASFRQEVAEQFAGVRQEFANVRQEFAGQLTEIRQEFAGQFGEIRQEVAGQFTGVRQEFAGQFAEVRQEFARVHQRLDSLDERVRHNGVLLEAVRSDVRLLAEGHYQLDQKIDRHRAESDAAHEETRALLRSTYRELDRRLPRMESGGEPAGS